MEHSQGLEGRAWSTEACVPGWTGSLTRTLPPQGGKARGTRSGTRTGRGWTREAACTCEKLCDTVPTLSPRHPHVRRAGTGTLGAAPGRDPAAAPLGQLRELAAV